MCRAGSACLQPTTFAWLLSSRPAHSMVKILLSEAHRWDLNKAYAFICFRLTLFLFIAHKYESAFNSITPVPHASHKYMTSDAH